MSFKRSALGTFSRILNKGFAVLGERRATRARAILAEDLVPTVRIHTKKAELVLYAAGEIPMWRAETFLEKEPETLQWIDEFKEGSVFWDVGANVGVYSLYAGLDAEHRVVAFEPSAFNYFILNKNVELNRLDGRIQCLNLAFNDISRVDWFHLSDTRPGSALHTFGGNSEGAGHGSAFRQGMIGMSMDDFIGYFDVGIPNHIKIDVDGNEEKIIRGARKTLSNRRL